MSNTRIGVPKTYSSHQIIESARITERQLSHWCNKEWLRPKNGNKQGVDREFLKPELDKARAMAELVRQGVDPKVAHAWAVAADRNPGGAYVYVKGSFEVRWQV